MDTQPVIGVSLADLGRGHTALSAQFHAALDRVLRSSAFCLGEEVERFEQEFAEYCRARQCIGTASGTAALTIMLQAAGIGPGDEVIVPAHTFIATALAVIHSGATPVCVDVAPGTGLLDPDAAADALSPATAAILAVHLYGQVCAMQPLRALAERHGLLLLEDAAQAHGASYRQEVAGSLGAAAAFSFYPSKNLGALGDGGAICTNDEALAVRARRLRDLGRGRGAVHEVPGYNERLDGLQAAFLRVKLPYVDRWNRERRDIAAGYRERLAVVELLEESTDSPCIYHLFPIRVPERDNLAAYLAARGVASGVHYRSALPDQPALKDLRAKACPVARDWTARELSLPIFPGMREDELEWVCTGVNAWADGNMMLGVGSSHAS